jgi:hypothetical protein
LTAYLERREEGFAMRMLSGTLVLTSALAATTALAAGATATAPPPPERPHFWAGAELGYGGLGFGSDQEARSQQGCFSWGVKLGAVINHTVRVGLLLDGWTVQSGNLNDPSKGIGVGEAFAVGQFYPIRAKELFIATAAGYASYVDNSPSGFNSHGWGASAGIGYDFKLAPHFEISPVATYSRGELGGVNNALTTITGRSYDAVTLRVGFMYH